MREHMARVFDKAIKSRDEPRNYVYGVNMRVGPDGRPHITEFGDVLQKLQGVPGGREPLVDVLDGESEVKVIAELPGIEKTDIELTADEENLTINVDTPQRKYHKELRLPAKIHSEGVEATYKNGVLEVTMKRVEKRGENRRRIKVE